MATEVSTVARRARVLDAMPLGVDLDLAQVSARSGLLPRQVEPVLVALVELGAVERVFISGMARVRYRRTRTVAVASAYPACTARI